MIPSSTNNLFEEKGPFCQKYYESGESGREYFLSSKILVIGAGGLGCEILKSLALTGFKNIDVIDLDTIDVSNLNRQFLFREKDVGRPKAIVAAEFIKRRIKNVNINAHFCKMEEKDDDFYKSFDLVIGGVDSVKARMWISDKLCQIAQQTFGEYTIPYIDGGTEEWKGHVKFIIPLKNACMRCQEILFPPPVTFQACTVASHPRQPEHCIVWAKELQWSKLRPNETIDGDNEEHIKWIMNEAKQHARQFKIDDNLITISLAKGVVKNIIPAIATTQAIIGATCATEALKYVTQTGPNINNNFLYVGDSASGLYSSHFLFQKKDDCLSCSIKFEKVSVEAKTTVRQLMDKVKTELNYPLTSLRTADVTIYMPIIATTEKNLDKLISEFVNKDDILLATSKERNEPLEFVIEGLWS